MNLSEVKEGNKVKICSLVCGHGLKHRLCSLGIGKNRELSVLKNDQNGPMIVKVLESKIVIGRGQANKIEVEKC